MGDMIYIDHSTNKTEVKCFICPAAPIFLSISLYDHKSFSCLQVNKAI